MTTADERRSVWILGAGFSRSLGGPLLPELLSDRARETIRALYPAPASGDATYRHLHAEVANAVRDVYAAGKAKHFWQDAEEYIDLLDAAASADAKVDASAIRFTQLLRSSGVVNEQRHGKPALDVWRASARRLVAAECTAFLEVTQPEAERWTPYHDWADALTASDSVLTFNYDRVLEILGRHDILPPAGDFHGRFNEDRTRAQVLKLHGSVDWKRATQRDGLVLYEVTRDPRYALTCPDDELAIATPGPSKPESTRELRLLWSRAKDLLHTADAIVFVGFRFPQTDAEARKVLLRAIEDNTPEAPAAGHHLSLHVVLGPKTGHEDVVRLEQLLCSIVERSGRARSDVGRRNAMRTYRIHVHAMWAEDFFTVFSREVLFR